MAHTPCCGARRWADERTGTASQAAPVLALRCIHQGFPQGHPRSLWMVCQRTQAALPARLVVDLEGGCGAGLMNSQAPRCRPRQCWIWRVCTGVIHKVIHAGCGVCGPHVGPLHGHWSIRRQRVASRAGIGFARHAQAFSTGSSTLAVDWFARPGLGRMARGRAGLTAGGQSGGAGAALMNSQAPRCRPHQCWLWRACPVLVHRVIHAVCGRCARIRVPCRTPCAGH